MKKVVIAILSIALLSTVCVSPSIAQVEAYDIVIMNGRIVDGSGNPWFYGDVAIHGDRIVKVGHLGATRAKRRIDARGLMVAPGFIDMLGQSEINLLIDPRAESKIYQGITTEITGEGGSIAPLTDYILQEMEPGLKHFNIKVDWRTLDEYFKRIERTKSAINIATYVGATQVRQAVLQDENRAPTAAELEEMKRLVAQAMQDGAVGISTSLVYAPAFYAKTEELIELAKVASRYGGVYASHLRNESNSIMQALDEAILIGKEANIPVEIFHLKMAGKPNWGKMGEVLKKIEEARAQGLDITADQYPYIAGGTSLGASIPPWAHEGGTAKFVERLKDPATREKLKQEMRTDTTSWENFFFLAGNGEGIMVASVLHRSLAKYEGKRVSEVAKMMGKSDEIDALFDLVIADNAQTGAIYFLMNEDDVKLAMKKPWVSVGVDHGAVHHDGAGCDRSVARHIRGRRDNHGKVEAKFLCEGEEPDPLIRRFDLAHGHQRVAMILRQLPQAVIGSEDAVTEPFVANFGRRADQAENLKLTLLLDDIDAGLGVATGSDNDQRRFAHGAGIKFELLGIFSTRCDSDSASARFIRGQAW